MNMPRSIRRVLAEVSMRSGSSSRPGQRRTDSIGRPQKERAEPAGRSGGAGFSRGLQGRQHANPLSRLFLPHPDAARRDCSSGGAYDYLVNGKMIGGFALHRLSSRIRQFRHHDLHGQSGRHGVSEGPRRAHRKDRAQGSRPSRRTRLAEGRRQAVKGGNAGRLNICGSRRSAAKPPYR